MESVGPGQVQMASNATSVSESGLTQLRSRQPYTDFISSHTPQSVRSEPLSPTTARNSKPAENSADGAKQQDVQVKGTSTGSAKNSNNSQRVLQGTGALEGDNKPATLRHMLQNASRHIQDRVEGKRTTQERSAEVIQAKYPATVVECSHPSHGRPQPNPTQHHQQHNSQQQPQQYQQQQQALLRGLTPAKRTGKTQAAQLRSINGASLLGYPPAKTHPTFGNQHPQTKSVQQSTSQSAQLARGLAQQTNQASDIRGKPSGMSSPAGNKTGGVRPQVSSSVQLRPGNEPARPLPEVALSGAAPATVVGDAERLLRHAVNGVDTKRALGLSAFDPRGPRSLHDATGAPLIPTRGFSTQDYAAAEYLAGAAAAAGVAAGDMLQPFSHYPSREPTTELHEKNLLERVNGAAEDQQTKNAEVSSRRGSERRTRVPHSESEYGLQLSLQQICGGGEAPVLPRPLHPLQSVGGSAALLTNPAFFSFLPRNEQGPASGVLTALADDVYYWSEAIGHCKDEPSIQVFAGIMLGSEKQTEIVAVKRIPIAATNGARETFEVLDRFTQLEDPLIVNIKRVYCLRSNSSVCAKEDEDGLAIMLVLEKCEGRLSEMISLTDLGERCLQEPLPPPGMTEMLAHLISGVLKIQQHSRAAHMRMHPGNVLLTQDFELKIGDCSGNIRYLSVVELLETGLQGALQARDIVHWILNSPTEASWLSPELLRSFMYMAQQITLLIDQHKMLPPHARDSTPFAVLAQNLKWDTAFLQKADAWATGATLFFIVSGGRHAYGDPEDRSIIKNILEDRKVNLGKVRGSPLIYDLVESLLESDPDKRLSLCQALCHPAFWKMGETEHFLKEFKATVELGLIRPLSNSFVLNSVTRRVHVIGMLRSTMLGIFAAHAADVSEVVQRLEFRAGQYGQLGKLTEKLFPPRLPPPTQDHLYELALANEHEAHPDSYLVLALSDPCPWITSLACGASPLFSLLISYLASPSCPPLLLTSLRLENGLSFLLFLSLISCDARLPAKDRRALVSSAILLHSAAFLKAVRLLLFPRVPRDPAELVISRSSTYVKHYLGHFSCSNLVQTSAQQATGGLTKHFGRANWRPFVGTTGTGSTNSNGVTSNGSKTGGITYSGSGGSPNAATSPPSLPLIDTRKGGGSKSLHFEQCRAMCPLYSGPQLQGQSQALPPPPPPLSARCDASYGTRIPTAVPTIGGPSAQAVAPPFAASQAAFTASPCAHGVSTAASPVVTGSLAMPSLARPPPPPPPTFIGPQTGMNTQPPGDLAVPFTDRLLLGSAGADASLLFQSNTRGQFYTGSSAVHEGAPHTHSRFIGSETDALCSAPSRMLYNPAASLGLEKRVNQPEDALLLLFHEKNDVCPSAPDAQVPTTAEGVCAAAGDASLLPLEGAESAGERPFKHAPGSAEARVKHAGSSHGLSFSPLSSSAALRNAASSTTVAPPLKAETEISRLQVSPQHVAQQRYLPADIGMSKPLSIYSVDDKILDPCAYLPGLHTSKDYALHATEAGGSATQRKQCGSDLAKANGSQGDCPIITAADGSICHTGHRKPSLVESAKAVCQPQFSDEYGAEVSKESGKQPVYRKSFTAESCIERGTDGGAPRAGSTSASSQSTRLYTSSTPPVLASEKAEEHFQLLKFQDSSTQLARPHIKRDAAIVSLAASNCTVSPSHDSCLSEGTSTTNQPAFPSESAQPESAESPSNAATGPCRVHKESATVNTEVKDKPKGKGDKADGRERAERKTEKERAEAASYSGFKGRKPKHVGSPLKELITGEQQKREVTQKDEVNRIT